MTEEALTLDPAHSTCPDWDTEHHELVRKTAAFGAPGVLAGYQRSGAGWRVANEIDEMAAIAAQIGGGLYCLGTLGNAAHAAEAGYSDHNPIVKNGGLGIVRAIDFGGPMALLHKLRDIGWQQYAARHPANYYYGYQKGLDDNQINNWGLPFAHHTDTGDAGHLHWSVTQSGYPSTAGGYVPAIDLRTGIGLRALLGGAPPVPPAPVPAPGVKLWQGYPVPAMIAKGTKNYFGDIDGNAHSLGGVNDNERAIIRVLQQRLNACGYNPGVIDGVFNMKGDHSLGGPTSNAVAAFQKQHMPGTTYFGQVWYDDWTKLFNL